MMDMKSETDREERKERGGYLDSDTPCWRGGTMSVRTKRSKMERSLMIISVTVQLLVMPMAKTRPESRWLKSDKG
jgi:hypothetical protein